MFTPVENVPYDASITLSLLFHPERLNRLVLQSSIVENQVKGSLIDHLFGGIASSEVINLWEYEDDYLLSIRISLIESILNHLFKIF